MVKSKKFSWRQLKQIYVTNTKIRTIVGMKKIRNWLGKVRKRDKITKNFSSVQSLSVRERVKNEISSELFEMSDKRFERSFSQQCKNLVKVLIDIIACYWLAIPLLVLEALKFIFPKRKNVSGQLVLVTGAGGGLGRSISLRLADLGCNIAVVDINQETAESVAQKLQKKGVRATAFKADISKYDEIKKLRNDVTNSMGKVDILINNAGLIPNMSTQMGPGFLEKMISVNVLGTIWVKFDIQRRSFKAWFFHTSIRWREHSSSKWSKATAVTSSPSRRCPAYIRHRLPSIIRQRKLPSTPSWLVWGKSCGWKIWTAR